MLQLEDKHERSKFESCVLNIECNKKGGNKFFTGKLATCKIARLFYEVEEQRLR